MIEIHRIFGNRSALILASLLLVISQAIGSASQIESLRAENLLPELKVILESSNQVAPALIEQNYLKDEADQRLTQARAANFPKIDFNANFGYRKDYRSGDENTDNLGLTYSARLTRPIYHWKAIQARIEQAKLDNDIEAIYYLQNVQGIHREIRSNYLTLLLNNISLRNEQARRKLLNDDLERIQVDLENGKISPLTYDSKRLDLENSLLIIEQIERDQARIISRFKEIAGWEKPLKLDSEVPQMDYESIQQWLSRESTSLFEESPESFAKQLTHLEIEKQQKELTIIKARQLPLVNFTASASQGQSNTSTQNNVDTFSIFGGISVSWNIFDGFLTKHQKIEAKLKKNRLEYSLKRLDNDFRALSKQMLDQLYFQKDTTRLLEARYKLQQQRYANTQSEASSGTISSSDLQKSAIELSALKLSLMEARAELLMLLSDYMDMSETTLN